MTSSLSGYRGPAGSSAGKKAAGYNVASIDNFTPEQHELFKQQFQNVGPDSVTSRLARGDQSQFEELERPAWKDLQKSQGQLNTLYSSRSASGRNTSGYKNRQNQLSSDFADLLSSKRMGLQRQAISDLSNMSNQLLNQRPYENFLVEPNKKPSFFQQLLQGGLPIAGAAAGGYLGGIPGAQLGASVGSSVGSAFSGRNSLSQYTSDGYAKY